MVVVVGDETLTETGSGERESVESVESAEQKVESFDYFGVEKFKEKQTNKQT